MVEKPQYKRRVTGSEKNRVETLGKPYNRPKKNRGGSTKRNQKEQRQKNIEDQEDIYLFH